MTALFYLQNPLSTLKDDAFFKNVRVDQAGYGVVWNDNVDLSESELWINGKAETSN